MTSKQTHITLTDRGKQVAGVGGPFQWTLAYDKNREVWGLAWGGRMTHMCYDITYAAPAEVMTWLNDERPLFFFDHGRELTATREELKAAFQRLGLLPAD